RIDEHGRPGGRVSADEQATRLLKVGLEPGKEGGEGAAVEDALALDSIDCDWQCREVAVEHAQRAGLKAAEHGARGRLDLERARLPLFEGRRGERQVNRHVERFVLA